MAPPCILGSLANATASVPPICPEAASAPLSSCVVSGRTVPGSNNAASRACGSRDIVADVARGALRELGGLGSAVKYGHGSLLAGGELGQAAVKASVTLCPPKPNE